MAAKKTPASPGTGMQTWKEELKALAEQATAVEKNSGSGGAYISTRGGQFTLDGDSTEEGTLAVVVLDHVLENHYYEDAFDPDERQSPVCFAFGTDEENMVPHEKSTKKQNDTCDGCPRNKFGTADKGGGKACKNVRRIGLLLSEDAESVAKIEAARVAFLKPMVTSVKNWTKYVRTLRDSYESHPLGFITEAKLKPHKKNQWEMTFRVLEQIEDGAIIGALMKKMKTIQEDLRMPYGAPSEEAEEEERPARRGKAGGPTKTGRR